MPFHTNSEKKTTSKSSAKEAINEGIDEGIDEGALSNHKSKFIESAESIISKSNLKNELSKPFFQNKQMYREFRAKGYNYEELKIDLSLLHEVTNTLRGISPTSEPQEQFGTEIDSNKHAKNERLNEKFTQEIDRGAVGGGIELARDILLGAAENLNDFEPQNGAEKHAESILIESIQKMAVALIKPGMVIHIELRAGKREGDDKSLLESLRDALKDIKSAEKYVIEVTRNNKKIEKMHVIQKVAQSILFAAEAIKTIVPKETFWERLQSIPYKDNEFLIQSSEELSRKFYNALWQFGEEGLPQMAVQAREVWWKWLRYEPQSMLRRGYSWGYHWFGTVSDETADADGEIRAEVLPLLEAMHECVKQSRPLQEASDRVKKEIWPQKEKFISATSIGKKTKTQAGEIADPLVAFCIAAQTMRDAVGKALSRAHGMSENLKQMSDKYDGKSGGRIEDFKKRFDSADERLQSAGGDLERATKAMMKAVDDKDRAGFWHARGQADAAISKLSSAIAKIELAVATTGRRLNRSSRDIRIAKHIAKDFAQKKAELREKYPSIDVSDIDSLVEKITKELVATEFVKRADPVGHVMAARVVQAYRQESTGEVYLPPTISEVLEKTEKLEDYFTKVGQRSLMSRAMFTGVNNSWDRLISCLPRNLIPSDCMGLLKVVATPITLWLAVTELEEAVTPGRRAPTKKEMAKIRWNIIGKATFKVFNLILPQVMKLAISLGLTAYAWSRKGLAEIVETSANDAPLNVITAGGLRLLGVVAGTPSEDIGKPIISNKDSESSGTEIGDIANRKTGVARDESSSRHGSDDSSRDENQIHNIKKRSGSDVDIIEWQARKEKEEAAIREFDQISQIEDKNTRNKLLFEGAFPSEAGASLKSMESTFNKIMKNHGETVKADTKVTLTYSHPNGQFAYYKRDVPLLEVARGMHTRLAFEMRASSPHFRTADGFNLFVKKPFDGELGITTEFKNDLKIGLSAFDDVRAKVFREKLAKARILGTLIKFEGKYTEVAEAIAGKRPVATLRYGEGNVFGTYIDRKIHGVIAIQRDNNDFILIDVYNETDLIHSFNREGSDEDNKHLKDMISSKIGIREQARLSSSEDNPFATEPAYKGTGIGPGLVELFGGEHKDYVSSLSAENFGSIDNASNNMASAQVSHSADNIEFLITTEGEIWVQGLVKPARIGLARLGALAGHLKNGYAQAASAILTIAAGGLKIVEGALDDDPVNAQSLYQAGALDIGLTLVTAGTKAGDLADYVGAAAKRTRPGAVVHEQAKRLPGKVKKMGGYIRDGASSAVENFGTDWIARDNPFDTYEDIFASHESDPEVEQRVPGNEFQFAKDLQTSRFGKNEPSSSLSRQGYPYIKEGDSGIERMVGESFDSADHKLNAEKVVENSFKLASASPMENLVYRYLIEIRGRLVRHLDGRVAESEFKDILLDIVGDIKRGAVIKEEGGLIKRLETWESEIESTEDSVKWLKTHWDTLGNYMRVAAWRKKDRENE